MKAVKVQSPGNAKLVSDAPKPSLRPGYILVKVAAVALNPTDWKHIGFVDAPVTVGCDYSGVVEAIGEGVTKKFNIGDRVFGVLHGCNESHTDDGAFGEYCVAKGDLQMHIPENMSFEAAATLGMGVATVGQGMYQAMKLPLPNQPIKEKTPLLIYGGSSAMGSYGIQYGVASGFDVLATASPHNFSYVKSLGASAVYDYRSSTVGADIRKATNNKLYVAWDAISEGSSPQIVADALAEPAPAGVTLKWGTILRPKGPRSDVSQTATMMYTSIGDAYVKGGRESPASKEDFEFMKNFVEISEKLIHEGKVKPVQFEVKGGIDDILAGLNDMKEGKVSGKKLVFTIAKLPKAGL
ncbi:putative zinc-binding oxidoreductase ToxD [Microthyrium microscopicum]|uniref:Putative zinc-binding oxidoreductase ToxD n=1 Tax=Microthyrium microscopicum TaxID=703497 RepID=A0A6A6TTQ1_9PEZI|nr:putative zinc-binding oxidoreductase ToxD [Microthyrium microscopicum]